MTQQIAQFSVGVGLIFAVVITIWGTVLCLITVACCVAIPQWRIRIDSTSEGRKESSRRVDPSPCCYNTQLCPPLPRNFLIYIQLSRSLEEIHGRKLWKRYNSGRCKKLEGENRGDSNRKRKGMNKNSLISHCITKIFWFHQFSAEETEEAKKQV